MTVPIEKIKAKFANYPNVRIEETSTGVSILPTNTNGFAVELIDHGTWYTVHFDGWHEMFTDQDEALDCLAFGLSDKCRLRITMRGSAPQKWTLEAEQNGEWIEDSTTGLLLFPFWRRKTTIFRSNGLMGSTGSGTGQT